MKNKILNLINYKTLELIAFILIIIWCLNPITVSIMKGANLNYKLYLRLLISIIGFNGYVFYIISKIKLYYNKKVRLKEIIKNNIPLLLILFLLIWGIVSTCFSPNKSLALLGESYRNEGLIMYFLYAGFILMASFIKNKKYISYIFKSIILSAIIIVTIPLLKKNMIDMIFTGAYTSIFRNSNHYGYYLLISSMLALFNFFQEDHKIKQILSLIVYSYLNYFLIINNTFGCYLSFLITIILLFIYLIITKFKIKKGALVLLIFITLSIVARDYNNNSIVSNNFTNFYSDIETVFKYETQNNQIQTKENVIEESKINKVGTNRMRLWRKAFELIKKHPIVGGGIECLNEYYDSIGLSQDRPHNIIIQIAAFIGIPGAIAYLILIFYLAISNLKYLFKNHNLLMITVYFTSMCYFISSLFGNSMYYTSPYFMILLGILIYYTKSEKTEQKTNN